MMMGLTQTEYGEIFGKTSGILNMLFIVYYFHNVN